MEKTQTFSEEKYTLFKVYSRLETIEGRAACYFGFDMILNSPTIELVYRNNVHFEIKCMRYPHGAILASNPYNNHHPNHMQPHHRQIQG